MLLNRSIWTLALALLLTGAGMSAVAEEKAAESAEEEWGDPMDLVGKPAPEIALKLLDGSDFTLSSLKGEKNVVLDFWGTWCPWCRKSTEKFIKIRDAYADQDVEFYLVAVLDDAPTAKAYLEKEGIKATVIIDTYRKAADPYWVDYVPHIVVIDKQGVVKNVAIGEDKVGPAMLKALSDLYPDAKVKVDLEAAE